MEMHLDDPVSALARAVAEGTCVDWEQAESSANGPEQLDVIRHLRSLAMVGDVSRAAAPVWGPLEIRGEIGSGSFGTVFRAWDTRLEREVALKILHKPASSDADGTAAVKEARLLARIRHPNVVTVYGADTCDGQVGIWTELVVGRTLKEIIEEQGPFGPREAMLIGLDICRALAAVHARGFLHRDIKAQNVMREAGGRVVLMDFGAGDRADVDLRARLTGTPAYLAPEVLAGGDPTVRSDIYSLGILLYHLVSGQFPVTGTSLEAVKAAHRENDRRLLRDLRPELPAAFLHVVEQATSADPAARPESAGTLEKLLEEALTERPSTEAAGTLQNAWRILKGWPRGLRYAGVAVLGLIVLLASSNALFNRAALVPRSSVVILPFKNLTGDRESDYFSDGVAADIATHLGRIAGLRVISGARYGAGTRNPVEIGSAVSAAAVLDGSVRRSGNRVRIVGQLLDARTGELIWSDSYDRDINDIFTMQAEVSRKIATALTGELSPADAARLARSRRGDFETFNMYLKGRYQWGLRTEDGFNRALRYFEDTLKRDPSFAPAYAGLADTFTLMGVYRMLPRSDAAARARAAAVKAINLDDTLAEAHASLGYVQKNAFEWQDAERSFQRAISLLPGYASAHQWYAVLLTQHGRFEQALTEIKIALSQDPLSVSANSQYAAILMLARRYDDAVLQAKKVLQMEPSSAAAYQVLAESHAFQGRYAEALTELARWEELSSAGSADQELRADLGYVNAMSGQRDEALAIARALQVRFETYGEPVASALANVYAALDEKDLAFRWLDEGWVHRDSEFGYIKVDPRWDTLRSDPRYHALLAKAGFSR